MQKRETKRKAVKKRAAATGVAKIVQAYLESRRAGLRGKEPSKNAVTVYTLIWKGFLLAKEHGYENNFVDYRHHFHCWITDADRRI
ncbi:hypothetical protein ACR6A7_05800 [Pantoea sp. RRHST58]|uniref:hypothetical protein n=1 Tax=Pantoea sp. RRHST58 TaxID=3425183 RepID=UPI003DA16E9D